MILNSTGIRKPLERTALVVFSGGQDSTTCLHWALKTFTSVETVFFAYGQRHAQEEMAAQRIAQLLQVPMRRFRLDFFREMGGNSLVDSGQAILADGGPGGLPNTFVPGRNLLFLTQAASYGFSRGIKDIVTGICQTDYSGYPDCRLDTLKALEKALHLGLGWPESGGRLRLHAPLMGRTKAETVRLAREWGAWDSLALSHTCYEGKNPPCGVCPACLLRAKGFSEAGFEDPLISEIQSGVQSK
jgi:7-cyano-7-deazaguanine synthase